MHNPENTYSSGCKNAPRSALQTRGPRNLFWRASQILRCGLRPAASRKKEALVRDRSSILNAHAHRMRNTPTDSEEALWRVLRASQLGMAFRRQVPVLGFIVDLLAPAARLIVEVDGGYHARAQRRCAKRREASACRVSRAQDSGGDRHARPGGCARPHSREPSLSQRANSATARDLRAKSSRNLRQSGSRGDLRKEHRRGRRP